MRPILVSSGEPAGIGPDLCLMLAKQSLPVVILGDMDVLKQRAEQLHETMTFHEYASGQAIVCKHNHLTILPIACATPVTSGQLNVANASYVIELLREAAERCHRKEFSALVTAPIQKSIINQVGIKFTGHTEFFADHFHCDSVVMLLACPELRVALVTTHIPLKKVAESMTQERLESVLRILCCTLVQDFGLQAPRIAVAGLNPHAGEGGYLGCEEQEIIAPVIARLQQEQLRVEGPFSADTLFTAAFREKYDVFLAMYHDQGLPVLKYAGFGEAVNVTLGLPIIRTSVDHGTALELAGTGRANGSSLLAAVHMAQDMAMRRGQLLTS